MSSESGGFRSSKFQDFVDSVRNRLNRQRWWTRLTWAAVVAGSILLLLALSFVLTGHRVPTFWYPTVVAIAALAAVVGGILGRVSQADAARFADDFFGLRDGVRSKSSFLSGGKKGGLYDLQYRATDRQIEGADVQRIPVTPAHRVLGLAALLLVASVSLGFKADSSEVTQERAERALTQEKTEEIKKHLEEELARQEEAAAEEETDALEPDPLEKWVEELKATDVREDALKQYARLEKKLDHATNRLQTRQEERLLAQIADELEKGAETRPLAKQLKEREYQKVAKELEKFEQNATKSLSEQQKKLAKLRSLTKRMAHAARRAAPAGLSKKQRLRKKKRPNDSREGSAKQPTAANSSASSSSNSQQSGSRSNAGANSSGAENGEEKEQNDQDSLSETLESLDRASKELEEALKEASERERQNGQSDPDAQANCQGSCNAVNNQLAQLAQRLRRLSARKKAGKSVRRLRKTLGSCSNYLCNSQGQSLGQCLQRSGGLNPGGGLNPDGRGGLKAGAGGSLDRRDAREDLVDNGQTSQLKGIKGSGPSNATVETAEDGSGASTRAAANSERTFRRQVEAFVEREDVPEDVKDGVKNYFENIHRAE